MTKSNLVTNTGHRFISKAKTAYKIHIHTPDDTVIHRSVGYIRIGEKKGLKKAIKLRNQIGYAMWGKYWKLLLKEPHLMTRLPHSLEPSIVFKPRPLKDNPDYREECYLAKWFIYDENGKVATKSIVRSVSAHGRLAAYTQTKKKLMEVNKKYMEILKFMGRLNENVSYK